MKTKSVSGACCVPQKQSVGDTDDDAAGIPFADKASTNGMKKLPGGSFLMGSDSTEGFPADGEGPVREVTVKPFYTDVGAVSNRQFNDFIKETGFRTDADTYEWSFVFYHNVGAKARKHVDDTVWGLEWWCKVMGANWRHPEGPGSNIKKRMDHPVTHVSWNDAIAYCGWAGKRLPTEAEWEYGARGGLVQKQYAWGDELTPRSKHHCNIWQGQFPHRNTGADGYKGTAPVRSFPANGFGLYNVSGNVWEWCNDWFSPTFHMTAPQQHPAGPSTGDRKVMRGGSFLCHDSYCNRYRVAARTSNTPDSSSDNLGFRCVRDVQK